MSMKRREFLTVAAAAGGALATGAGAVTGVPVTEAPMRQASGAGEKAPRSLKILILGGTNLTGPHTVRYALERGHEVSIFTRGRTQPGLFREAFEHVEQLIGDRADDLSALEGRSWDVVIDASGREESWTRASAELLRDSVGTYVYISSTGVYYPYLTSGISEDTPVAMEVPPGGENLASTYGVMKARSELEAQKVFGDRTLVLRPGYIVGPLDGTHRGTYWPHRIARGGDVLVPGKRSDQVQQIDVRDLTEWMVRLLEDGVHGTFNVTGPAGRVSMEEFVYAVRATFSSDVRWTWIEDYAFLVEHQVFYAIPWILPMDDNLGSQRIDVSRARAAGLTYRPMAVTARDTLAWYESLSPEARATPPMAISPEKEVAVLAAWRARQG